MQAQTEGVVSREWTIDAIKRANADRGLHYFERGTMRFFRSRVGQTVYQGPGGIYFVTSEQFVPSSGRPEPRRYSVRKFNPETADISTAGGHTPGFQRYSTSKGAANAAKVFAAGKNPYEGDEI